MSAVRLRGSLLLRYCMVICTILHKTKDTIAPQRMVARTNSYKMGQKIRRQRGRPRAYDREVALTRAMDVFWAKGYAATSLDDLSLFLFMIRPPPKATLFPNTTLYRLA